MKRRHSIVLRALCVLVLAAEAGRLAWFRSGENMMEDVAILDCQLPADGQRLALEGSRASEVLSYDGLKSIRVQGSGSPAWVLDLVHLDYAAGNPHLWRDLFSHPPEICFPASGARLLETYPARSVPVDGHDLYFRHLMFEHPLHANPVHVFKAVWLAGMDRLGLRGDETSYRRGRLAAAQARTIPPGAVCLVMISNAGSPEDAWAILQPKLVEWYRMTD